MQVQCHKQTVQKFQEMNLTFSCATGRIENYVACPHPIFVNFTVYLRVVFVGIKIAGVSSPKRETYKENGLGHVSNMHSNIP